VDSVQSPLQLKDANGKITSKIKAPKGVKIKVK
jgi:hypothetical protein